MALYFLLYAYKSAYKVFRCLEHNIRCKYMKLIKCVREIWWEIQETAEKPFFWGGAWSEITGETTKPNIHCCSLYSFSVGCGGRGLYTALFKKVYRTIFQSKRQRLVFKTGVIMF